MTMGDLLLILIGTALANNLVLVSAIGLTPLLALSRRIEVAQGMAIVSLIGMPISALIAHGCAALLRESGQEFLRLPLLLLALALAVKVAAHWLRRRPRLQLAYGSYLPLLGLNSLLPGVALLSLEQPYGWVGAAAFGLGCGLAYALTLVLFASLYGRLVDRHIPAPFRGAPIALISLALMSMGLAGLAGLG